MLLNIRFFSMKLISQTNVWRLLEGGSQNKVLLQKGTTVYDVSMLIGIY